MYKYKALKIKGSRIDEHRKKIQDIIGRKLDKNEVVHHINGNKRDNRIENLQILSRSEHTILHLKNKKREYSTKKKISDALKGKPRFNKRKLSYNDVFFIKTKYIPKDKVYGCRALARMFGVNHETVRSIIKGKTYIVG